MQRIHSPRCAPQDEWPLLEQRSRCLPQLAGPELSESTMFTGRPKAVAIKMSKNKGSKGYEQYLES